MAEDDKSAAGTDIVPAITVERAKEQLASFLTLNPASRIEEIEVTSNKRVVVVNPWGDPSLIIEIPPGNQKFNDAMNCLHLPEQFTAIWHADSKAFEIIYTAYPLTADQKEVKSRQFSFRHNDKEHMCEFAISSDRLLEIAHYCQPISDSTTQWRNIPPFNLYARRRASGSKETEIPELPLDEPLSFWVRDVDWDDDEVLSLVNHLNFYMIYYDTRSPHIVVHSPPAGVTHKPRTRYILGHFPEHIISRQIDQNLLQLWLASNTGDAARRFLYSYRIIEYASYFHLETEAKTKIRKLLEAPHALDDLASLTEHVIGAVQDTKIHETQKIDAVLRTTLDPKLLWKEMQENIGVFTTSTTFDGGFVQAPITTVGTTDADFGPNEISALGAAIRDIRNALSHGRDQKTIKVITPTARNFERLQPWASLIAVAAGEVIVYRNLA